MLCAAQAQDVVFPQHLVRTLKFYYQFLVALNGIYIPHGVSNDMYLALYSIFFLSKSPQSETSTVRGT